MPCPVGRDQSKPCPRKTAEFGCQGCVDDWTERAAIIEYQGEQPRAAAERQATFLLREQLARAESPQMEIKL